MEKSIFTREYRIFTETLRAVRTRAGMTQVDLAAKLQITQSYLSKVERGQRRLDMVQVRDWCQAMATTLPEFVSEFERRIGSKKR